MLETEIANSLLSKVTPVPTDLDEFLASIVKVVRDYREFYLVILYLFDSDRECAILQAAIGEGARGIDRHIEEHGEFKRQIASKDGKWTYPALKGELSLSRRGIGTSPSASWRYFLSPNDSSDGLVMVSEWQGVSYVSPLFPNGSWKLIIPLRLASEVIGTLDVYSDEYSLETSKFDLNTIKVLQLLADKLADHISEFS
jgi:hypothetical protein